MERSFIISVFTSFLVVIFCLAVVGTSAAMEFSTKYSLIQFSEYKDMDDFIWRLGGERVDYLNNPQSASSKIDRIVDRVQTILGIIPRDLRFRINLCRGMLKNDLKSYYEYNTKSIYMSVDYASQGILAHEIGHAIINNYFPSPIPSKVQEILVQYIDKYLWTDY